MKTSKNIWPKIQVYLGKAISLKIFDKEKAVILKFKNCKLTCNSSGKRIFITPLITQNISENRLDKLIDENNNAIHKGSNLFSKFWGEPSEYIQVYENQAKQPFTCFALAECIVYKSKREGESTEYIHNFPTPPNVWTDKSKDIFAITGGKIQITERGII